MRIPLCGYFKCLDMCLGSIFEADLVVSAKFPDMFALQSRATRGGRKSLLYSTPMIVVLVGR